MRTLLIAAFVSAAFCGAGARATPVPLAYQPGGFPRDEASLRDIDMRQLRIVRRAGAQCWHSGDGGFHSRGVRSRACVIGLTESAVQSSENPELQAYHQALPFHVRYNEYRPAYYWQRFVAAN